MPRIVLDGREVHSDNIRQVFAGEELETLLYTARQVEIAKTALAREQRRPFERSSARKATTTRD